MSGGFTAPAVMDALATAFRRVSPLDGEVRDGNEPGDDSAREVIAIGFSNPDDDNASEAQSTPGGLGPREKESYDIHCAVAAARGDGGLAADRARVFEILSACRDQLVADPTLAKTCMQARIASWSMTEADTTGGPVVRIRFDVHVEAFTTR
jgi:hypothetical protein